MPAYVDVDAVKELAKRLIDDGKLASASRILHHVAMATNLIEQATLSRSFHLHPLRSHRDPSSEGQYYPSLDSFLIDERPTGATLCDPSSDSSALS